VLDVQNPRISTLQDQPQPTSKFTPLMKNFFFRQEDHTVHLGKMMRNNTTIRELYLGKQRIAGRHCSNDWIFIDHTKFCKRGCAMRELVNWWISYLRTRQTSSLVEVE